MIDIENKVLTVIADALETVRTDYPNLMVTGEAAETVASFPMVTVIEEDNYTYRNTQDTSLNEHHASVMYEINVYANNGKGRKMIAKRIANIVDTTMQGMKFTRTMKTQVPNQDRSIYRVTMRYTAVVGAGVTSGNDTVYQIYRK